MNLLNQIVQSKKSTIATMIACAGLSASVASAQFKVEYSSEKADKEPVKKVKAEKKKESKSVMVVKSSDDDHEYEVKVINGDVVFAKMDGDELDKDQIQIKDDLIVIVDGDGEALYEIKVPGINKENVGTIWTTKGNTISYGHDDQDTIVEWQPKVMLGIRHTEPSKVLLKQLKLDDEKYGLMIDEVIKGLPADLAGLMELDLVLSIDGSEGASADLLTKFIAKKDVGDKMKFLVLRDGQKKEIEIKLKAYDGIALGNVVVEGENMFPEGKFDFDFDFEHMDEHDEHMNRQFFATRDHLPESVRERIMEALHSQGIDGEQAEEIEIQIRESLGGLDQVFSNVHRKFDFNVLKEDHENRIVIAEEMREKAEHAMRQARERVLELREGQLFVRSAEELHEDAMEHLGHFDPEGINTYIMEMDERFEDLEDRLEDQLESLEDKVERIADMFERLIEALEDDED